MTPEIVGLAFALASAVATGGIAWGVQRAKVADLTRRHDDNTKEMREKAADLEARLREREAAESALLARVAVYETKLDSIREGIGRLDGIVSTIAMRIGKP